LMDAKYRCNNIVFKQEKEKYECKRVLL